MTDTLSGDEKREVIKKFNHRLNNDLQALMAFMKLQKRFGIDDEEIVNFSYVSIASISAIQNLMYNSKDDLICTRDFLNEFLKILNDHYMREGIAFSNDSEDDIRISPKAMFHLMMLLNEMIDLSFEFSFEGVTDKKISFRVEENGDECLLTYSDNGSGISQPLKDSEMRMLLFDQLVHQIDGTSEFVNCNTVSVICSHDF